VGYAETPDGGLFGSYSFLKRQSPIESRHQIAYPSPVKQSPLPLALILLLLAGCQSGTTSAPPPEPAAKPAAQQTHATATFDFYLLNLSWSPEFCHSHPTAAECAAHSTFVLHGLWPQNDGGSYPQNCSTAPGPADPSQYRDIYPDPSLLEHEWRTHGTCSGLSPEDFFSSARKAFHSVTIPPKLAGLQSQISLPPGQILELFTASNPQIPQAALALSCGNSYLTAVEVCLGKSLQPIACGGVRSCRANTVRIPPP
jgi:ribonuclease T2